MKDHSWIEISLRIYKSLLCLYPREHRAEYGADMLQVFKDQCRSAYQAGKGLRLLSLWLRTLLDLGSSALREQISSPHALTGLLEPVPNRPLPWKGAALVLLPGLAFFIAQVEQLQGKDWFYFFHYRAGYFMILPVLLVWLLTRRFPIWGLVPLGLLFRTLLDLGLSLQYHSALDFNSIGIKLVIPVQGWLKQLLGSQPNLFQIAAVAILLMGIVFLLWRANRRANLTRGSRAWIGVFVVLTLAYILINAWRVYLDFSVDYLPATRQSYVISAILQDLFVCVGFLFLIVLGTLLSPRQGRLAVLLPIGYLLPAVLVGRYFPEDIAQMAWVVPALLGYRLLVALAAPLWIVRTANGRGQTRASAISLLILVGIQAVLVIRPWVHGLFIPQPPGTELVFLYPALLLLNELILAAGMAVALHLYAGAAPAVPQREQEVAFAG